MEKWKLSSQLAAAEQAYVAAEMARLRLIFFRKRMDRKEYQRELSAAWLCSVDALEILTVLEGGEVAARLKEAAEELEPPEFDGQ